jgi:hypothetical protein
MKKTMAVLLLLCALLTFSFINSCKHDFLQQNCNGVTVVVTATKVNPSLNQSNGSITITAIGGSGFTYRLDNGSFQNSNTFGNLAAGNYVITAKNASGCTGVINVFLTTTITNLCAGVIIVVSTTKIDPTGTQANGSITATASGSTGFTYSLNNGAYQASATFTGLVAGNYTVTAKNINGCTGVADVILSATDPCAGVTVVVTTTQVNPTTNQSNGSITATATGSTGFTYSLNNGVYQASGTFTGLATGNYTITAKSALGCLGTATVALGATNPCAGITIVVSTTQVNPTTGLANGSITASASGGTGFTYSLNNGAYQASGTFTGLAAGTYSITAKSATGCLGTANVVLAATNPCTNTNIIITTAIVDFIPCSTPVNNGKITVTATGSTGFTYNFNGGTYQANNIFSALAAGTYTVGVKDLNGCTKSATATVGTAPRGPLFAQMRTLITTKCGGSNCHMNGGNQKGYNFDNDCSIVTSWSQIKQFCITNPTMPPGGQLSAAEKLVITNWVNAGHAYGN